MHRQPPSTTSATSATPQTSTHRRVTQPGSSSLSASAPPWPATRPATSATFHAYQRWRRSPGPTRDGPRISRTAHTHAPTGTRGVIPNPTVCQQFGGVAARVSPGHLVNLPPTPDAGQGGAGLPPRQGGASQAPSCPGSNRTSFAIPCQLGVRRPSDESGLLSPAQPGGASTPIGNAEGTAPTEAPTPSANAPGSSYPAQHGGTTTPRRNAGGLVPGAAPARAAEPSTPAAASTPPSLYYSG